MKKIKGLLIVNIFFSCGVFILALLHNLIIGYPVYGSLIVDGIVGILCISDSIWAILELNILNKSKNLKRL